MHKPLLNNPGCLPDHPNIRRKAGRFGGPVIFTGVLLLLLTMPEADADSIRCGRKVVRSGDAQSDLLRVCGEPQRRDSAQEAIWIGSAQKNVRVQRWYYKSSSRTLERVVLLYQGKVIEVQTGSR